LRVRYRGQRGEELPAEGHERIWRGKLESRVLSEFCPASQEPRWY